MANSPFVSLAAQAAQANNIPIPIFDALIQRESGWNPNAQASGSTAYGLTQLTQAAQQDVGVTNINDPRQQLFGGAEYLAQMASKTGNWFSALEAFNQGPNTNYNNTAGKAYANSVLTNGGYTPEQIFDMKNGGYAPPSGTVAQTAANEAQGSQSKNGNVITQLTSWVSSKTTDFSVIFLGGAIILVALLFSKAPQKIIVDTLKAAK